MKATRWVVMCAAVAVVALAVVPVRTAVSQVPQEKVAAWEYKRVKVDPRVEAGNGEAELNQLGRDGWELIAVEQGAVAYLKRPAR